ncbi:iron-containing alcohol dehydrogenase (plasmid) [Halarchaeum sp. CBA1220]|uniref:iron-containing alcohol dehydrogenase family protein n=1 Tax=Halarchaeum sp. CBA1220 TaxID=1853682 RepID=UPI000F3AA91A|nr:iron-containing alcohol dehydrogenase family protein [Halarchaeum sp. CBA1220]QLC34715.1 iron-containing alcohol dehydrogenase [Halarchaeum sp. CBA1220]
MHAREDPETRFRFDYRPAAIRYGQDEVRELGDELARLGVSNALVVAGTTTGTTPAVIDPVREGAGERLGGVFAETTPEKRLDTALAGAARYDDRGCDGIVALGGGSSLDVAAAIRALVAHDEREEAVAAFADTGRLPVPKGLPPLVVVPTTLAGADLSLGAGLTATPANGHVETPVDGGLSAPGLMPDAAVYDPELVATTPTRVLCASAMNGFDKGVESLYARTATPITDGTAARGLALLRDALPTLRGDDPDYGRALRGTILVQYGVARPDGSTLALIHAFGHGLTAHAPMQQGVAHGAVAPHALAHLFAEVDGRRELLADALGVDADDPAEGVVAAVASVRDALGLPARLRDVDGVERAALPDIAATTAADALVENVPAGVAVDADALEGVLDAAW